MSEYAKAGVNIDIGNKASRIMGKFARNTFTPDVLSHIGLFGGLFGLKRVSQEFKDPVLVTSMDGVGTKLWIATMMKNYSTVGQDLVNHCVNDILTLGAKPLFFLDYIGARRLDLKIINQIGKGIAKACRIHKMVLIGGETAEMPIFYSEGDYDLISTIVGVVEKEKIIDGRKIETGDLLIGLPSNGLHTNGYSLARKIFFDEGGLEVDSYVPELKGTIGEELLRIHKSYFFLVYPLLYKFSKFEIHGIAHITGGGLIDNIARLLPKGLRAEIDTSSWKWPPIFQLIQKRGRVSQEEMLHVFNCGIGMVLIVPLDYVKGIRSCLRKLGEETRLIGVINKGKRSVIFK